MRFTCGKSDWLFGLSRMLNKLTDKYGGYHLLSVISERKGLKLQYG